MQVIQGDLFLKVGLNSITVNPSSVTRRMSDSLNQKLTQARIDCSDFKNVPPKAEETKEEYKERVKAWAEEQDKLNKDESADAYLKRQFEYRIYDDNMNYMYACVKAIAEMAGQGHKLGEISALDDVPIIQINNFVARVCKVAKVPIEFQEIQVDVE